MLEILINGLIFSGSCAILAVGFSLVFGVAKILNMAHTGFYMVSGFLLVISASILNLPLIPSSICVIIIIGLMGMLCYTTLFDRVKEHETAVMIISIALVILFQETLLLIFGGSFYAVPQFISGFAEIAGVRFSYQQFFSIGANIVTLIVVWFLLAKSRMGNAIRAVAQDAEIASALGINVSRIYMITIGLSLALAGFASVIVAPITMVDTYMWLHLLVLVMAAVVLGGLGSIKGSVIAALILGFTETIIVFIFPKLSFLRGAFSMSVMVAVLIAKPDGLFGVVFEEERL